MAQNEIASGLLFAGTLYSQSYDPNSGLWSAYPLAFTSDTNYSTKQGPSIAPLRR